MQTLALERWKPRSCSVAFLAALATSIGAGCSDASEGWQEAEPIEASSEELLPWKEFKARAERVLDGKLIYVVEWDLVLRSEDELRAYYDGLQRAEKSTVYRITVNGTVVDNT